MRPLRVGCLLPSSSLSLSLSFSAERFDTKEDRARHNARKVCSYHEEFSVVDNYVAQLYDTE